MGKAIVAGGKVGMKAPITIKPNFNENEWSAIILACQTNNVPDTWVVGSQKTMTIDGVNYPIDIIGKNHDDYADGSGKAPLTFQMHGCYHKGYGMNSTNTNNGGWTNSLMRTTHLPEIKEVLPTEVKAALRKVSKKTSAGSKSTTLNTTDDDLFLPSEVEVFGSVLNSTAGEGSQYDYYAAGNNKVKSPGGAVAPYWWMRSPWIGDTERFCIVNSAGQSYESGYAANRLGVAFAFCF